MLFRVAQGSVEPVVETSIPQEALYEKDVEDWVEQRPELLGQELVVIGRQVELDDGKDRIDLLAIDKQGSLVVIELKRDLVGGAADLQPLRYAALVSSWSHEQVRRQAEGYWTHAAPHRGTFVQEMDEFLEEDGQVNADQRVVLVGRDLTPRLGTVALWLRAHGIDAQVVTVSVFKHDDDLLLQPQVVIPVPSEDGLSGAVSVGDSSKPWKLGGQAWHMEQRLSPAGRAIAERVIETLAAAVPDAAGPNWAQKHYISWQGGSPVHNWLYMRTGSPHQVSMHFPANEQSPNDLAELLGWPLFDGEAPLAEKLAMGSSVGRDGRGTLRLIVKQVDDLGSEHEAEFAKALQQLWDEFIASA